MEHYTGTWDILFPREGSFCAWHKCDNVRSLATSRSLQREIVPRRAKIAAFLRLTPIVSRATAHGDFFLRLVPYRVFGVRGNRSLDYARDWPQIADGIDSTVCTYLCRLTNPSRAPISRLRSVGFKRLSKVKMISTVAFASRECIYL